MTNSYTTIASNRSLFTGIVHLLNTGLDSLDAYTERVAVFNNTTFDQRMQMILDAMGTEAEHEAALARMFGVDAE
jgi:hypothetical protein